MADPEEGPASPNPRAPELGMYSNMGPEVSRTRVLVGSTGSSICCAGDAWKDDGISRCLARASNAYKREVKHRGRWTRYGTLGRVCCGTVGGPLTVNTTLATSNGSRSGSSVYPAQETGAIRSPYYST